MTMRDGTVLINERAVERDIDNIVSLSRIFEQENFEKLETSQKFLLKFYQSNDGDRQKIKDSVLGITIEHEKFHGKERRGSEVDAYVHEFVEEPNFYTLFFASYYGPRKDSIGHIANGIKKRFESAGYSLEELSIMSQEELYGVAEKLGKK